MTTMKHRAAWLALCLLSLAACDWLISSEQRMERASAQIARGEYRGAFIDLQHVVRDEPSNFHARSMLADVSLRLDDAATAEREIAAAVELGATAEQTAELQARIRLSRGEFESLLEDISASKIELSEPARSTYRGMALLGLAQIPQATAAFEAALETEPTWQKARIGLAEAWLARGETDKAAARIEEILKEEPTNALGWSLLSRVRHQRGDTQGTIDALKNALDHAAGQLTVAQHTGLIARLIEAQLEAGDITSATATHAELSRRAPEAPLTRLLAARLAMLQQQYSTAIAELQKALAAAPEFVPARLALAAALLANGNLNQAEAELAQILRKTPDNIEARKLLAQVNLRLRRPAEALKILESSQVAAQADPQVDSLLGLAKLAQGDEQAAIMLMERSLSAQPGDSRVRLDLALAYMRAGEHSKAKELLRADTEKASAARRSALLIATAAAADGRDAAIAEVERVVAANAKDAGVLNVAASFFVQQGDLARAKIYSDQALALDAKDAGTLMLAARIALSSSDLAAAHTHLEQVLKQDSSNNLARVALAQVELRRGNPDEATRWLEEVRSADPGALDARFMLASIYLQQNKLTQADQILREVWSGSSDKARASSMIGKLLAQSGRYDDALQRFREAARYESANPDHLLDIASVQSALGNAAAARESIVKAISLRPDDFASNAALAILDARAGNRAAAQARIERLHNLHPKDARVAGLKGDVAMIARAYREAADAYARASALQPAKEIALREYHARRLGGLEGEEKPLETWLDSNPHDHDIRLRLAEIHAARGDRRSAINHYEHIVRAVPSNATVLNNLGWLYFEEQDGRAEAMAKRAFDLAPDVAEIADTYGWILVRSGKAEAGLPVLERAAANAVNNPDIHYHLAAALSAVGQREKARAALHSLLAAHSEFSEATAARELLEELDG